MRFPFGMPAALAVAVTAVAASSAMGGFTISHSVTSIDAALDRIDLYARNTGGDTGTGLVAAEIFATNVVGQSFWRSAANGNWSATNSSETDGRSWVRIDEFDPSSSSVIAKHPAANQPLSGANTVALGDFGVTVASLTGPVPAETGAGARFASFFVTKRYWAYFHGNVGGSAGSKVPFSSGSIDDYAIEIQSITPNPASVLFGPVVSTGAAFSVTVEVGAPEGRDVFLTFGQTPEGIHDLSVVGGGTQSRTFTVSGLVDYSLNGMSVDIPFTAHCPGIYIPSDDGSIRLTITPEPAMLFSLLPSSLLMSRKRRGGV